MSDYTDCALVVYACPEDEQEALIEVIEADGSLEREEESGPGLFGRWVDQAGARLTLATDLGASLAVAAPGATFEVWTSPKYEYLGTLDAYAPALGHFVQECGDDGDPVFTRAEVLAMRQNLDQSGAQWARSLGIPWEDRFIEFRKQQESIPT